ncbi:MAG TPA: chorismate-binding protein [Thermoanaerobaculia bacterium]|jgi:anthranilate synthase component 1|nr:chorismate-binding protein [Thermoanaerobaculia bacterium]HEV8608559.1 chorismate-binding protein [Thermoanaerobaculia bacterium]
MTRSGRSRIVPVARELALAGATPMDLFRRMRASGEECFLLESVEGGEAIARYTFLGVAPSARLTLRGRDVEIEKDGRRRASRLPLLPAVEALTLRDRYEPDPDLPPFVGGAVGFLGYDAARVFEEIPDRHTREGRIPDALFLRFDSIVAFDRARGRLLATTVAEEGERETASARLDRLEGFLSTGAPHAPSRTPAARGERGSSVGFAPAMPKEDFLGAVEAAKEAILAGEIYQVVLSERWTAPLTVDPLDVYEALRELNPSPYLFYLQTREAAIFGASPEMLVRCRGRHAETRPIAGTIRRGATPEEDDELARRMLADPKERAEHVMLVDLGRNDLGRVCEIGSVEVTRYADVERYSHVQHLVSEVHGVLAAGHTSADLLASCFPAGTLTGAPKIRAMELIDELEDCRRSLYGGAVGYLDHSGDLDMAIAIRTAVVESGICRIQAGAGIVADSIAENEYREAESKAQALFRAVEIASDRAPSAHDQ